MFDAKPWMKFCAIVKSDGIIFSFERRVNKALDCKRWSSDEILGLSWAIDLFLLILSIGSIWIPVVFTIYDRDMIIQFRHLSLLSAIIA